MSKPLERGASYAGFRAVPDNFVAEIIAGELHATAYFTLAPDWLCEVLSPTTETIHRTRKLTIYGTQGVGHVWLVNPLHETLEVLRLDSQRWSLLA